MRVASIRGGNQTTRRVGLTAVFLVTLLVSVDSAAAQTGRKGSEDANGRTPSSGWSGWETGAPDGDR